MQRIPITEQPLDRAFMSSPTPDSAQQIPRATASGQSFPHPRRAGCPPSNGLSPTNHGAAARHPNPQPVCALPRSRKSSSTPVGFTCCPTAMYLWPRLPASPRNPGGRVPSSRTWCNAAPDRLSRMPTVFPCLRDANGDGVAEEQFVFLEGLRQPFGMALIGDQLYVANTDSVVRFPYRTGDTRIAHKGTKLLDLPVGHHWTRALLASPDGSKLFVTVGSGSNIGEKGLEIEEGRATILEFDIASGRHASLHQACATPTAWRSSPSPAHSGQSSTSATRSAMTCRLIISHPSRTAASTAGPTATGARMSTRGSSPSGPIL